MTSSPSASSISTSLVTTPWSTPISLRHRLALSNAALFHLVSGHLSSPETRQEAALLAYQQVRAPTDWSGEPLLPAVNLHQGCAS